MQSKEQADTPTKGGVTKHSQSEHRDKKRLEMALWMLRSTYVVKGGSPSSWIVKFLANELTNDELSSRTKEYERICVEHGTSENYPKL